MMSKLLKAALPLIAVLAAVPAQAAVLGIDQFRNESLSQTGDGPTLSTNGYYFSTRLFTDTAYNYTSVSNSAGVNEMFPDPGVPSAYNFTTGLYTNKADMDADFGAGGYLYSATDNFIDFDYLDFDYSGDEAYPVSTPYLAGTSYSDLQGLDASQSIFLSFSPYDVGPAADEGFIFFSIYDLTLGAMAYTAYFLPPTTTGVNLLAGSLQADHDFQYDLVYSNRVSVPNPGFANTTLGFDRRTIGTFATASLAAVPEPASLAMCGLGVLGVAGLAIRRRMA